MNSKLLSYNNEIFRKIIHLSSLIIPLVYFYSSYLLFIIFLSLLSLTILFINSKYDSILSRFTYIKLFFSKVLRGYEKNKYWGASYLILGFLIITLLFDKNIVITSMIITSLSDSLAAILGIKYGRIRLYNNKSIEGFYIFYITTFSILFFLHPISLIFVLLISLLISLVELFTPTIYDNVSIPICSSIILTIFNI